MVALAEDGVGLAADAVAVAATTQTRTVEIWHRVEDSGRLRTYEDYVEATYTRNTRNRTVGALTKTRGWCEGPLLDNALDPPLTATEACSFKRTANGPSKVAFVSSGHYRTSLGPVVVDERRLTETFEATYTGTAVRCDPGGSLPVAWRASCQWKLS